MGSYYDHVVILPKGVSIMMYTSVVGILYVFISKVLGNSIRVLMLIYGKRHNWLVNSSVSYSSPS